MIEKSANKNQTNMLFIVKMTMKKSNSHCHASFLLVITFTLCFNEGKQKEWETESEYFAGYKTFM